MVYLSNYEMITRRQVNELSLKCEMRPSGSQTLKAPLVETHLTIKVQTLLDLHSCLS
jgi:hypothetical protein